MRKFLAIMITMLVAGSTFAQGNPLENKANNVSGTSADELAVLGHLYIEAMRLSEAKTVFRSALKLEPKNGKAEFGQIRIDMAKGKLEKTKTACRVLRRRHKTETIGEVCSGWGWLTFDRSARAIDEFEKVVAKGDTAQGQTGLAEAYRRRADDAAAILAYKKAIDAGAGYIAYMGLGLSQESIDENAAAKASLKKATEIEPASCMAHFHYGRVLGKGSKAISHLQAAVAIRPKWSEGYETLGKIQLVNGDFQAAKGSFEMAIEIKAKSGEAHLGLGKALYSLGKQSEAKQFLTKAIKLVPNLVDAYLLLADIEYAGGETDAALEALDKAKAVAPGVVKVYIHTGEIYFRLGRYTSANGYMKRVIQMKKDLSLAYVILGDIACERRLYDAGHEYYDQALKGDLEGVSAADINKRKAVCKSPYQP